MSVLSRKNPPDERRVFQKKPIPGSKTALNSQVRSLFVNISQDKSVSDHKEALPLYLSSEDPNVSAHVRENGGVPEAI